MKKIKLLLYCTKGTKRKDLLWSYNLKHFFLDGEYNRMLDDLPKYLLNGKIVAECDFEVEEIECRISIGKNGIHDEYTTKSLGENELLFASKIDEITFINYLKGKNGYAIHIKNLNIFDKPKELFNYIGKSKQNVFYHIEKAPQNMMYCYGKNTGEKYILISIRPEWLCKILNGEKTIECRKRVLKGMIG